MRTIIHLHKKCNVGGRPLGLEITKIYRQYKEQIYEYRSFRKTAATTRTTFQDQRIEELVLSGKTDELSVRKKIKNIQASYLQNKCTKFTLK